MNVKEVTVYKEYKKGLPSYSSVSAGYGVTVTLQEGDELNLEQLWRDVTNEVMNNARIEEDWQEVMQANEAKQKPKYKYYTKPSATPREGEGW